MIRKAVLSDAGQIARLHVQSWQESYQDMLPQDLLDSFSVEAQIKKWGEIITSQTAEILIMFKDRQLAGFVNFAPCADEYEDQSLAEIRALYISKQFWRKGFGTQLLAQALSRLGKQGFREVVLWVLVGNRGAMAFYRKNGFVPEEIERKSQAGHYSLAEKRMIFHLARAECFQ